MNSLPLTFLLVAVATAGTACGSITAVATDAGSLDAPVDVVVTTAVACHQQATAICTALDQCAKVTVKFLYGDQATCVARQELGCSTDQMISGTTRTPDDILGCARDVAAASCADVVATKYPTSCLVKPGAQAAGTACGTDWQCASAFCDKGPTGCGTCAARSPAGGACTVDAGCQTGLVCANSVCVMPGTLTLPCDTGHPCRGDLYCTKAASGTCQLKVGLGGTCLDSDQACDASKSVGCNPFNHTCETFNVAVGGDACGIVGNALTVCVNLGPCPGFSIFQAQGVCANPAADGAACGDAANGLVCLPPATCDSGACRLPSVPDCR